MVTAKKLALQILVGLCLLPLQAAEPVPADKARDLLRFKWAFLVRDESGATRVVDFSEKVTVTRGDALQIYLEPVTNVYLYLYMFDAQKQLRCLFPASVDAYDKGPPPATGHLLPGDGKWYIMDAQKGTEKLFLLASAARLTGIEALTRKMAAAPDDAEVKSRLLDEIQIVRRAREDLTVPVEKGVPMAGTVVAVTRGPAGEATLTEATGFYARTLRLEHE